ncbi:MAG: trypsin-like peptidase domain-containing protein [Patescibacteria group bacterium]
MSPATRSLLANAGALGIVAVALILLMNTNLSRPAPLPSTETIATTTPETPQVAAAAGVESPASSSPASKAPAKKAAVVPVRPKIRVASSSPSSTPETGTTTDSSVVRIQDPYPFPPRTFSQVNEEARAALVNILCAPRSGSLRPISGSGVIIDPRGVIITNAHVAQYVLLSEDPRVDLSCVIRTGAPARTMWSVEVLYIPPVWVKEHAKDLLADHATGTGEHDYALLHVTGPATQSSLPLPDRFPALPVDTRDAIGFLGDLTLVASYPAEFIGGIAAQFDLYPASSVTPIQDLLTFRTKTVDLISLGGIIEAQSGSSGGAVVNAWGRLIGIITTTSEGKTTAERDLRAITLSYINSDLAAQSGFDLAFILGGDIAAQAADFKAREAPALNRLLINQLTRTSR